MADEVGLGKTIEAGMLLAQRSAKRKRSLLIITPANLREQWHQELADKSDLPAVILGARSFRRVAASGKARIVICSSKARTELFIGSAIGTAPAFGRRPLATDVQRTDSSD